MTSEDLVHSSGFVLPLLAHLRSDPDYFRAAGLNSVKRVGVIREQSVGVSLEINRPFCAPS
jgi:hypothetical protein